jgi:putative isomerase
MGAYDDLKKRLARGWNTWNARSVLSHVLLPEGFALNLGLKEYQSGRYLKESLIGRFQPPLDPVLAYRGGEYVEKVRPGIHAYDGSITELRLEWRGIVLDISTATTGSDLVMLVRPVENQRCPASLVLESGILWNREGSISASGEVITASLPGCRLQVHTTAPWVFDPYVSAQTPYAAMRLDGDIGISTGTRRSLAEIVSIVERRRAEHEERRGRYLDLAEAYDAMQTCLAWATIYEPKKDRVLTTISRTWDIDRNFGGYLLAQDLFYHACIASLDNKDLAYANLIGMLKEKNEEGFVPFAATGAGFSTMYMSSPPLASPFVLDFYRRFGDRWLLEESFEALLDWNRWRSGKRMIAEGLLAWGSNPIEPAYDHYFELNGPNDKFSADRESGYDNSTMWDDVVFNKSKGMHELADVGHTSLFVAECEALAEIAEILGRRAEAAELRARSRTCAKALEGLWDEKAGIFLSRHSDTGRPSLRLSPSNFYPLYAGVATEAQAERMVAEHFHNPEEFWGEWMMPSSPRNDPGYKDQYYWRGRVWAPMNFHVYLGLHRYGLKQARAELAEKSKALLLKEWRENRHVHENYNADLGIGCDDRIESEKFYTWSGLLAIPAMIEAGLMAGPAAAGRKDA